jgi:hypothetical protein
MDNRTIFTKTAKGLGESIGKTKGLSRESRKVIIEVNGVASFNDLLEKLDHFSESKLTEILIKLKDGDYIREFNPPPVAGEDQNPASVMPKIDDALTALTMGAFLKELAPVAQNKSSLDFTDGQTLFAKTEIDVKQTRVSEFEADTEARKKSDDALLQKTGESRISIEGDQKKQREAETKIKKETDDVARKLEKKKKEKEAEDKAWAKFEAKAKAEEEARAQQKVEEDALKSIAELQERETALELAALDRIAIEEQERKTQEAAAIQAELEKAKQEATEASKKLAAAQRQKEADDKERRRFEENAKKEAEEKLQHELEKIAEEFARQEIEQQAKFEQEEKRREEVKRKADLKAQQEAEEKARLEAQKVTEELARQAIERLALEQQAKREQEEKQREEAEEKQRQEAKLKAELQAQHKAEEEARIEAQKVAEELTRQAIERQALEQQAKLEQEEKQRKEAEEKQRQEEKLNAELQAQQEAEEKTRLEAQKVAEELTRQAIERQALEQQAKLEQEEKQRKEAEEKQLQEAQRQAQLQAQQQAEEEAQIAEKKLALELLRREAEQVAALLKNQKIEMQQKKETEEKKKRELELKKSEEAAERARLQVQSEIEEKARDEKIQREADERMKTQDADLAKLNSEQELAPSQTTEDANFLDSQAMSTDEDILSLAIEQSTSLVGVQQTSLDAQRDRSLAKAMFDAAGAAQNADEQIERQARLRQENQGQQVLDLEAKRAADDIADRLEEIANEKISEAANAQELADHQALEAARLSEIAREKENARQAAVALTQKRREERILAKLEQKKQREAERNARRNIPEAAPASSGNFYDTSRGWGISLIGIGLVVFLVLFAWTQLSSFDEKRIFFEKAAAQQFQQPVKIKKLGFDLLPQPHWQFEEVEIGTLGQIKIPQISAPVDFSALFNDAVMFNSAEFQSPVLSEEGLRWVVFGQGQKQGFGVTRVSAKDAKVESGNLDLGAFDLDARIGANKAWQTINLVSSNKETTIELRLKDEVVNVKINSKAFLIPFGSSLTLGSFSAEGEISPNGLLLSKFYGVNFEGILTGSARLMWDKEWTFKGDVKAKQIVGSNLLPELFEDGQLEGEAKFQMQAREANKLFSNLRVNGTFVMHNGTIRGVDMVKLLQGNDIFGTSSFKQSSGVFSYEAGKTRVRNLKLAAGLVSANGYVDVNQSQEMEGRFGIDLTTPVRDIHTDLVISGSLKKPRFSSTPLRPKTEQIPE